MLTNRQEKIWAKKMVELEKRFLEWQKSPTKTALGDRDEPDGSFMMSAFKEGYWLGRRKR